MNAAEVIEIKSWLNGADPEPAGVRAQRQFEEELSAEIPEPIMQVVHLLLCLQILNMEASLTPKGKLHMAHTIAALREALDVLEAPKQKPQRK